MHYINSIILTLCLLLTACTPSYQEELLQAESLVHEYPDSSLTILQEVPSESLKSEELRARYALFYSIAQHKSYIDVANDSLISIASDYYNRRGEQYYRMLANYYHAYICFNMKQYSRSSLLCLKAEKDAEELEDHFYLGLTYWLLGDIYLKSRNGVQFLYYAEKALTEFNQTEKERFKNDAGINVAFALNAVYDFQQSLDKCLIELEKAEKNNDTAYTAKILQVLAGAQIGLQEYEQAKHTLLRLIQLSRQTPCFRSEDCVNLAMLYSLNKSTIDSAQIYLSLIPSPSSTELQLKYTYTLLKICEANNDFDAYVNYSRKIFAQEDSLFINVSQNKVTETIKEHYQIRAMEEMEQRIKEKEAFIVLCIIFFLSICLLIVAFKLYRSRQNEKQLRLENTVSTLHEQMEIYRSLHIQKSEEMERVIKDSHQSVFRQKSQIIAIFRNQYEKINKILSLYADDPQSSYTQKELIRELDRTIDSFHANKTIKQMEEYADKYLDGIMQKLRAHFTTFSERDFVLLLYLIVGFTPKAISLFVKETPKNIYNRKYRLKERIEKSSIENKQEIIQTIFDEVKL